jgi:hypothetical protein
MCVREWYAHAYACVRVRELLNCVSRSAMCNGERVRPSVPAVGWLASRRCSPPCDASSSLACEHVYHHEFFCCSFSFLAIDAKFCASSSIRCALSSIIDSFSPRSDMSCLF